MGKKNKPLNIKTAVELPIFKLGLPSFRWSFYFLLLIQYVIKNTLTDKFPRRPRGSIVRNAFGLLNLFIFEF